MNRTIAVVALACLASSCATVGPPAETRFQSPRPLLDAADCVARNVENYGSLLTVKFTPRWKIFKNPESIEIGADAAWVPFTSIRAKATIEPNPDGSLITVEGGPGFGMYGDLKYRMAEGC